MKGRDGEKRWGGGHIYRRQRCDETNQQNRKNYKIGNSFNFF